jgi:hypothetical protein
MNHNGNKLIDSNFLQIGFEIKNYGDQQDMNIDDALPNSLVDPLEGLTMWKCGRNCHSVRRLEF